MSISKNQADFNSASLPAGLFPVVSILGWVAVGPLLLITNRSLLTSGLSSPVTLTCIHLLGSCVFSNVMVYAGFNKAQHLLTSIQVLKVFLLAAVFGLGTVSGVAALAFIPVSFNEMIGGTTTFFTALAAFILLGETQTWIKLGALVIVISGATVSSGGEIEWNTTGVALSLLATICRAFKAVMQQLLLTGDESFDSMNLMRFMSVFSVMLLVPLALVVEGPSDFVTTIITNMQEGNLRFLAILLLNIFCAFVQNILAFLVTQCVGAVSIQVIGAFKGVVSVLSSIAVFNNPLSAQSALGYIITTAGVGLYTYCKVIQTPRPEKSSQPVKVFTSPQINCRHDGPFTKPPLISVKVLR